MLPGWVLSRSINRCGSRQCKDLQDLQIHSRSPFPAFKNALYLPPVSEKYFLRPARKRAGTQESGPLSGVRRLSCSYFES